MTIVMQEDVHVIQRGDTYKLLAACFYEPEKQLFLEEEVCQNLAQLLRRCTSHGEEAAEQMHLSLQQYDQQQLSIEHAALFVGPFELIAAPYSSVWQEKHRLVMGNSTMAVKRFYEETDLKTDVSEPPDHIAIMLEFMSYLCRKEAEAIAQSAKGEADNYLSLQKRFFHEALSPWIADFCNAITTGTSNSFYSGLANALNHFIDSEQRVFA